MAGKYELLCLENPLLDIQGVGYVFNLYFILITAKNPADSSTATKHCSISMASTRMMPSSPTPRSTWASTTT